MLFGFLCLIDRKSVLFLLSRVRDIVLLGIRVPLSIFVTKCLRLSSCNKISYAFEFYRSDFVVAHLKSIFITQAHYFNGIAKNGAMVFWCLFP